MFSAGKVYGENSHRRVKAEFTNEYNDPESLNSTFSNDFNVLFFGDAFVYDINFDDTGDIDKAPQEDFGAVENSASDLTADQDAFQDPNTTAQNNIMDVEYVTDFDVQNENIGSAGNVTSTEEAAVIKGVEFDIGTTSFLCSGGSISTHGDEYNDPKQIKQVIEYDYDLVISAGSDVGSALDYFESALLSYLVSELELSGCVVSRLLVEKISSMPDDTLNESAFCDDRTLSEASNLECHPINGYISTYYSGDLTIGNDLAESILSLIMNGMRSKAIVTKPTFQTYFIGLRSSSTEEINMLLNRSPTKSKSIASTISMVGAGLIVIVILGFAVFTMKRKYKNDKSMTQNKIEKMPADEDVENAVQPQCSDYDSNDSSETDLQGSVYYDHSISSASTQMVSNRRLKPVENPLYLEQPIVEETLSEDEADDALPSFHNKCCY